MASTTIFINFDQKVLVSHICSKCGFPVISVVTMKIQAQQSYLAFREKAEKQVREAAVMAVEDEMRFIESNAKIEALTGKERLIGGGYGESLCKMSFSGHDSECPCCSHIERWQIKGGSRKTYLSEISGLKDENFPVVFGTVEEADRWARIHIAELSSKINEQRNHTTVLQQMISNTLTSHYNIISWKKELSTIPELEFQRNISRQLEILKERKKGLGVLNFGEKKELSTQIKALETNLNDINKVLNEKVTILKKKISEEEYKVLNAQALAFGCSERVRIKEQGNSFVYSFVPNSIPAQYLLNMKK